MAQHAPTEQALSSQFHMLYHLLETCDGRRHKHTTKLFPPVDSMQLRKARYAFSLVDRSSSSMKQAMKTGTIACLHLVIKTNE